MLHAYIFSACRTPIGRFRGVLSSLAATDLGSQAIAAALHQSRIPAAGVESVILGQVLTAGAGQAPARQAALHAGVPAKAGAMTINQVCGSGLQAVMLAAQAVRSHDAEVVVAGGMESMSRAGFVMSRDTSSFGDRTLVDTLQFDGLTCATSQRLMGDIAEGLSQQLGLTRGDLDQYALESHRRACSAIAAGTFREEIVPVTVRAKGQDRRIELDEGPRAETSRESLAALPPVFRSEGVVTAGNASMISDGAAALVIGSEVTAKRYGIPPLARIVASVTVGGPPEDLFLAPVQAILQVTQRAQCSLQDIDLFEINEAFAAQVLGCLRGLDLTSDRVNLHGGAIALGHPLGASGARVLVTLLHSLRHHNKRRGVAALCLGGGNAVAMLVERC
jgi:acetyl-CoA C-acetyltransferase